MGTIRSYEKQMRLWRICLLEGERKMGRKNCAVIMLTSACLVLTACAPTEFSRAEWHRAPESDGGGRQTGAYRV